MSSNGCANDWVSIDGREWFISNRDMQEPNGDYHATCYLGSASFYDDGYRINDGSCRYSSGTQYMCGSAEY